MHHKPQSLARFLILPENRSAHAAVVRLAAALSTDLIPPFNPLLLHGPPGSGKSHLISGLIQEVLRKRPGLQVQRISARDLREQVRGELGASTEDLLGDSARHADLTLVEDLGHLPPTLTETFTQALEERAQRDLPTVCSGPVGPRQLSSSRGSLPSRLRSRLAAGLVVALEPLQPGSRRLFLEKLAQQRQLALATDVLHWLAEALSSGRQLEGAIAQLDALARLRKKPPTLAEVQQHFRAQVEAGRPSVQRIARRVEDYFRLPAGELQSRRRFRSILVARQVGMFLARQLTALSLEQIGLYYGGRDHTTVLHACRKIERALEDDALLSGAVRQLQSEMT